MAREAGDRKEQSLKRTGKMVTMRNTDRNDPTKTDMTAATVVCSVQRKTDSPTRKSMEESCSKMGRATTTAPTRHLMSPFRRYCLSRALSREVPVTVAL